MYTLTFTTRYPTLMVFGRFGVEKVKTSVFVGIRLPSFEKEILRTLDTSCGVSSVWISSSETPERSGHRITPFDEFKEGWGVTFTLIAANSVILRSLSEMGFLLVSIRSWSDFSFLMESTVPIILWMVFWIRNGESLVICFLFSVASKVESEEN